jgi:hypothetical protein
VLRKPFNYDPELMEKTRWSVERGLHKPSEHGIERQLELPLPMPPREPERAAATKSKTSAAFAPVAQPRPSDGLLLGTRVFARPGDGSVKANGRAVSWP